MGKTDMKFVVMIHLVIRKRKECLTGEERGGGYCGRWGREGDRGTEGGGVG